MYRFHSLNWLSD